MTGDLITTEDHLANVSQCLYPTYFLWNKVILGNWGEILLSVRTHFRTMSVNNTRLTLNRKSGEDITRLMILWRQMQYIGKTLDWYYDIKYYRERHFLFVRANKSFIYYVCRSKFVIYRTRKCVNISIFIQLP